MGKFYVTTLNDVVANDGQTSLREALTLAAANAGADEILFSTGAGTILLNATLVLAQDVTINGDLGGDGTPDITIDGQASTRLMTINSGTVTLDGLNFRGGYEASAYSAASAIYNSGALTLRHSVFTYNYAYGGYSTPTGFGAGGDAATILSLGTLTIADTSFSQNVATAGAGYHGAHGSNSDAQNYAPPLDGYAGYAGGNAASAILQFGASLTLQGVMLGTNAARAGAGGYGGQGGTGGYFDHGGGYVSAYDGANGGPGGNGGSAGAIVTFGAISGSVTAAVQSLARGSGGLGGFYGDAGSAFTNVGSYGPAGADGSSGIVLKLGAATGSVSITHLVTNDHNTGSGSLRAAIAAAAPGDAIAFSSDLKGHTILLASTLTLSQDVTINGDVDKDGAADITISGNDAVRLFNVTNGSATFRSLTLTDGDAGSFNGGAIVTSIGTTLTLVNSTVSSSTAIKGGGIYAGGTLNIAGSTINGNQASSFGGGLYVRGNATFVNATIAGNSAFVGGGIDTFTGSHLYIRNSTISANNAGDKGGGIDLYSTTASSLTRAVIYNSIVSGNTANVAATADISRLGGIGVETTQLLGGFSVFGTAVVKDGGAANSNAYTDEPGLGALANNGGPVLTMRPMDNSVAIGRGSTGSLLADTFDLDNDGDTSELLPVDAHGSPRVVGALDAGAYERSNQAPAGVNDANGGDTVKEDTDTTAGGNVLTNDTDFNIGDSKTVNGLRTGTEAAGGAFGGPGTVAGTYGSLTLNADGTWSYALNNAATNVQALANGATVVDSFTYRVVDGLGLADTAQLDISINGTDDAPTANNDTLAATEDTAVTFTAANLIGNDTDRDTGTTLSVASVTSGPGGTVVLNGNGTVTFTPNANFNGAATFTYMTEDNTAAVSTAATVTVNVAAVNDAPVITSGDGGLSASVSVAENNTAVTTVTSTDVEGTARTYSLSGTDASRFSINASTGVVAFVVAPDFEAPADANSDNTYDIIVTASDGSLSDTQALAVSVTNVLGHTITGGKRADTINGSKPAANPATIEEDKIDGKAGNDTVNALGGNDTVKGGIGKDVLDGGTGIDTVDFSDQAKGVVLTLKNGGGIAKIGGLADDKVNNFENVIGGKSNDTLTGDKAGNMLKGGNGDDQLDGGKGDDNVVGDKGNDTVNGGLGNDLLTGNQGNDRFVFNTKLGATNIDVITDFKPGQDKIQLDGDIFATIGSNLESSEFFAKAGAVKAKQPDHHIIYDTTTGDLYFDKDGKGGAAAIHFATLGTKPAGLDHTDFVIV